MNNDDDLEKMVDTAEIKRKIRIANKHRKYEDLLYQKTALTPPLLRLEDTDENIGGINNKTHAFSLLSPNIHTKEPYENYTQENIEKKCDCDNTDKKHIHNSLPPNYIPLPSPIKDTNLNTYSTTERLYQKYIINSISAFIPQWRRPVMEQYNNGDDNLETEGNINDNSADSKSMWEQFVLYIKKKDPQLYKSIAALNKQSNGASFSDIMNGTNSYNLNSSSYTSSSKEQASSDTSNKITQVTDKIYSNGEYFTTYLLILSFVIFEIIFAIPTLIIDAIKQLIQKICIVLSLEDNLTDEDNLKDADKIINMLYDIVIFCLVVLVISKNWYYLQAYKADDRVASDNKRMPISFDNIKDSRIRSFSNFLFYPMILPLKFLDHILLGDYGFPLLFRSIGHNNINHFIILIGSLLFLNEYNIFTYFDDLFRGGKTDMLDGNDLLKSIVAIIISIYCLYLIGQIVYDQLNGSINSIVGLFIAVFLIIVQAAIQIVIAIFSIKPAVALCVLYFYGCSLLGILWYKNDDYNNELKNIQTELDKDWKYLEEKNSCDGIFFNTSDEIWYYMVKTFSQRKEFIVLFFMIVSSFYNVLLSFQSSTLMIGFPFVAIVFVIVLYNISKYILPIFYSLGDKKDGAYKQINNDNANSISTLLDKNNLLNYYKNKYSSAINNFNMFDYSPKTAQLPNQTKPEPNQTGTEQTSSEPNKITDIKEK